MHHPKSLSLLALLVSLLLQTPPSSASNHSFFPRGLARNSIRNLPPHTEELRLPLEHEKAVNGLVKTWEKVEMPKTFDWRKKGVLTPVKDQKYCAAPYAFAFVGMLESQFKIRHGELQTFSVQQLIDCHIDKSVNFGCNGGHIKSSYDYVQTAAGLQTEFDYPFEGRKGKCRYSLAKAGVQTREFLAFRGADTIRRFIFHRGPVSVYINPVLLINNYSGNILRRDDVACSPHTSRLTHIVLIVGYGVSRTGTPYWIVRNSWGPRWGYGGYFYVERGTNACGIEELAFFSGIE